MRSSVAANWLLDRDGGNYVVTPNVDHIVQLEKDVELRAVYRDADLILTDGKPLIWISKGHGSPIKEKISRIRFVSRPVLRVLQAWSHDVLLRRGTWCCSEGGGQLNS
mgnify:CR=1 FL=1